jgi:hypothetical protein
MERWREYEDALALAMVGSLSTKPVCEWLILGRGYRQEYVWAWCTQVYSADGPMMIAPAVIHIGVDGSAQSVDLPGSGRLYNEDIARMFPPDVQGKIAEWQSSYIQILEDRLRWRRGHPDEPPWIVLSSMSVQPTQAIIPLVTPDPAQVENWREYQTAIADNFWPHSIQGEVLCEWEILGSFEEDLQILRRYEKKIYVWAICGPSDAPFSTTESLAVIGLAKDGLIQSVKSPYDEIGPLLQKINAMFPQDVQSRYFSGLIHFQELVDHLRWRRVYRDDPPLIVFWAAPAP